MAFSQHKSLEKEECELVEKQFAGWLKHMPVF